MTIQPEESAYLAEVARRIRAARAVGRISQGELASRTGLSRVTLGSIERGEHAAGVITYLKIARGLAIDVGHLLTEQPAPPRPHSRGQAAPSIHNLTVRDTLAQLDRGNVGLIVPKEDDPETVHAFVLKAYPDVCAFVESLAIQAQAERN